MKLVIRFSKQLQTYRVHIKVNLSLVINDSDGNGRNRLKITKNTHMDIIASRSAAIYVVFDFIATVHSVAPSESHHSEDNINRNDLM